MPLFPYSIMKFLKLSEIKIENRQRRTFDEKALTTLADSIRTKGLLHPIVLQDDSGTLVAGERRYRAIALLDELSVSIVCDGFPCPQGYFPYVTLGSLSEDDLIEAELEENTLRENLTWAEEAEAIERLHSFRVRKSGGTHTYKDTAQEIVGDTATTNDQRKVREAIQIANHLDDADVLKAKTHKDALKIIKRKAEQVLTNKLAQEFNILDTPHVFNNGDFRNFNNFVETGSVDLILTDPPYGIGADTFGDQTDAAHGYDDSPEYFQEIMTTFFIESARVTKPKAHMYIFCDPRMFIALAGAAESHGWEAWPMPMIWSKSSGIVPRPGIGPRRTYEAILYAFKGDKPVHASYNDVISIPRVANPAYGAEKPVSLYEELIMRSCYPGELIWDPFAGAGPIFPAANRKKCRVVATELSEDKFNYAKLRINETEVGITPSLTPLEELFS